MFISLITVVLAVILQLNHQPKKTLWAFLSTVEEFLFASMKKLLQDFNRKLRKNKGRQKIPIPKPKTRLYREDVAIVSPITREQIIEKEKKKKALEKAKKQRK